MAAFDDEDLPNMVSDIKRLRDRVEELDEMIDGVSVDETVLVCPICFNRLRSTEDDVWCCQGTGLNYTFLGLSEVCGFKTKLAFRMDFEHGFVERVRYSD